MVWRSWSLLQAELNPLPAEPGTRARLERVFFRSAPQRLHADFFTFRSAEPRVVLWVRGRQSLAVLMSVGFLEAATDESLRRFFAGLGPESRRRIRIENVRHSVGRLFAVWKGERERFRYWFVSFWLFPIERLLTIARI